MSKLQCRLSATSIGLQLSNSMLNFIAYWNATSNYFCGDFSWRFRIVKTAIVRFEPVLSENKTAIGALFVFCRSVLKIVGFDKWSDVVTANAHSQHPCSRRGRRKCRCISAWCNDIGLTTDSIDLFVRLVHVTMDDRMIEWMQVQRDRRRSPLSSFLPFRPTFIRYSDIRSFSLNLINESLFVENAQWAFSHISAASLAEVTSKIAPIWSADNDNEKIM